MIFTRINHRYHSLNSRVHVNVGRSRWLTAKIGMLSVVMFAILLQIESDMGTALTGRWKAGGRHYDWSNPTNQRHQNPSQKNTCDTLSKGGPAGKGKFCVNFLTNFNDSHSFTHHLLSTRDKLLSGAESSAERVLVITHSYNLGRDRPCHVS